MVCLIGKVKQFITIPVHKRVYHIDYLDHKKELSLAGSSAENMV